MPHPTPPTPDARTFRIAAELSKLEKSRNIEVFAPQIIAILRGASDSFNTIDERPVYFNELAGRFYMLRAVRNHPVWGPRLFAAMRSPDPS